jgi:hypothetical protein
VSTRLCALLAAAVALLGVALRLELPVEPVDEAFRDVIRFYRSLERS